MGTRGVDKDVEALANAYAPPIQPPQGAVLRSEELALWGPLIQQRSRAEWTPLDLRHLVTLCRLMVDIDRITLELQNESDVTTNAAGTEVANPKYGILDKLQSRPVTLTRLLHLQAQSKVNDVQKLRAQRDAERIARDGIALRRASLAGEDDDELLARPPGTML